MASSLKETSTLNEKSYRAIYEQLVCGPLRPGCRLSEVSLAKELGISRTPIREAIGRLVSEGLVEKVPNGGAFVRKPTRVDLEEIYELREWMETCAVGAAAKRITREQLKQLRHWCEQTRAVAYEVRESKSRFADARSARRRIMADLMFHMTLMQASGNRRVMKIIRDNHCISQVWRVLPDREDLSLLSRVYRDHRRIIRHLERGDATAAQQCMLAHIRQGRDDMLRMYDWQQRIEAAGEQPEVNWPEGLWEEVQRTEESGG